MQTSFTSEGKGHNMTVTCQLLVIKLVQENFLACLSPVDYDNEPSLKLI